ncbi:MAG TPA: class I SAM-dependent methyltransferase [Acidimicrobiales bacterium]|nr:class I SAM-dependent methyltransferase [Acidimicrobiales bacterium]
MVTEGGWKPKASLDQASRRAKATKIATLIETQRPLRGTRLLEIGTGGGIITTLLAELVGSDGEVWSVDVDDLRTSSEGYSFKLVEGTTLPFGDDEFDIVISNHTIEHVGDRDDQLVHLREIERVLAPDGLAYLATPTRWALVEPHFKVPMLSWLPPGLRTAALRVSRRGHVYDIDPRTRPELVKLIDEAGLQATEVTMRALRITAAVEESGPVTKLAAKAPDGVLDALRGGMPTMVFLLTH